MVHALREAWRVLRRGGVLIDDRPLATNTAAEIVTRDGLLLPVGDLDGAPGLPDDVASEQALAEAVASGWFVPEARASFRCHIDWESVDEMPAEMSRWKLPSAAELALARRQLAHLGSGARIRIRHDTIMTRYCKIA
jgi:hypothetical protein